MSVCVCLCLSVCVCVCLSVSICLECTGFLNMPKRPHEWRVDSHGCYKFNNADLAFGPRDSWAHFPVFLHLRTANLPGPDCAQWTSFKKDGLNGKPPSLSDGRGDRDERDVVYQDHVSAYLPAPFTVTSESSARPLFLTALMLGHFASCLHLSLSVAGCLCLSASVCVINRRLYEQVLKSREQGKGERLGSDLFFWRGREVSVVQSDIQKD